jgi:hypothetical protein
MCIDRIVEIGVQHRDTTVYRFCSIIHEKGPFYLYWCCAIDGVNYLHFYLFDKPNVVSLPISQFRYFNVGMINLITK